ncbi:alpha-L-fucosidase [Sphingobacterium wenxiniae]|uniref:alpha-L-fucosidase n=1 Tax=Sphingobacterium wenxiniae TaxID=683125 RepID=A0A1I6NRM1_9SPHI|nr:alpha-L-fucosidase [Sphingobacterium wenxiniae]SFS30501.1 alpha-L-fucosidase [Sphingobacterium wenxiniae]
MKLKTYFSFLTLPAMLFCAQAQDSGINISNTIKIDPTDSKEKIIEKAAHVVPTVNQLKALRNEFIAFIHFGPNTFTRMEWGNGMEDPKIFDLKELDTDQWCEALKAAGMKMVILTVKHHDGFVLWQSRYTDHGVMSTGFRGGKGDILKDLSASCQKYGLKLGVYLSPADLYQIENPEGLYGNLSKYTKRTIPSLVGDRPFANKKTFTFEVDDYNEYFLNQLFEILTEYGPIHEVWFDGAHPKRKGNQQYNYAAWMEVIRILAPEAVVFGREDIRWCGNESGATRQTEWNVLPFTDSLKRIAVVDSEESDDIGSRKNLYGASLLHYQQAETNTSIREGWFYRDNTHQKVRSVDDVFDIYERSVGGNSTFLLNIPPNREGRFSDVDVSVLQETGKRIEETYGQNLLKGANTAKELLDNNDESFVLLNQGESLVIETKKPITFNRLLLQEAVATHSERIEAHVVEAWVDGTWKQIAKATNIGYKRILRFPEVTTDKIRLRITQARLLSALSTVSAHYYRTRPPQLQIQQDVDGMVTIAPLKQEFNWKPHGENASENLNLGYTVHYTTDGTIPTVQSPQYNGPFIQAQAKVSAVAVFNGEIGAVSTETVGIPKKDWKAVDARVGKRYPAEQAFDADTKTFFQIADSETPQMLTIDLGKNHQLEGMIYTPQTYYNGGMMAKGFIEVSRDGKVWKKASDFEFGNLVNDPSKREHRFAKKIAARYVRITATEVAGEKPLLAIAELDLF